MQYPVLRLKPERERAVRQGHPWVFAGALSNPEAIAEPGQVVELRAADDSFLGYGTAHPGCTIAVRIFTRDREPLDTEFFARRLHDALALREPILRSGQTNAYRLVHGEGDRLPGFVVDVYGDTAVLQCLTAGAERLKHVMVETLHTLLPLRCIYERSTGAVRREEGLEDSHGPLWGVLPEMPLIIRENGLSFFVDVVTGQKTGFFLDQRDNRAIARDLAPAREVLNAFAYSGAFSVYAAAGGAARVVSVESSRRAASLIERHWVANELTTPHELVVDDVFTYLRNTSDAFDLIVLDPPALVKRRPELSRGTRAYYDLHTWALRRAKRGAWLLTFSCSQHVTLPWFAHTLERAAAVTGRTVQVARILGAALDHPTLIAHPEGQYLKGLLAHVR
ncbi:MAG: ribosomal RNA large subunit methyltransferase I [Candidatus Binatia bacterium]|nr:MAG: ribosomal RNA large subunit methyltransferase I [Candidatus Binatia bacterium]